jgi:pimeloyl-ACP methyl ester carboxylesterase
MRAVVLACLTALASGHEVLNLDKDTANLVHTTRILYPQAPGAYPVLTFLHGFALDIETYDQILKDAAESCIVILFQMKFRALNEGLDEDAALLDPYLHDPTQGILPRIGSSILSGYSVTSVGLGGHSRGGGVLAYALSHGLVQDGDYSAVVLIDPVVMKLDTDVAEAVALERTKLRVTFYNDDKSMCVTNGWPDFGGKFSATDLDVLEESQCKHMDVCSSWGSILPLCHSFNGADCKAKARALIADAGFGEALLV